MPELPEVETVKNALYKKLVGRRIVSSLVYWDNIIAYPDVNSFNKKIIGECINDIKRRGKFILFVLDKYILLSHLRMEGKYNFKDSLDDLSKHDYVMFTLDDGKVLAYNDTRKFGKMYLIDKDKIDILGPIKDLGLEPFSDKLDVLYLKDKYSKVNIPIKSSLLDQSVICGIGNIYADEILYLARINPNTLASSLDEDEIDNIIKYTREVLSKAISLGGSSIHTYKSVDGVSGSYQDVLLVHNKSVCPSCGGVISKIKIRGRGTYFCPNCQK